MERIGNVTRKTLQSLGAKQRQSKSQEHCQEEIDYRGRILAMLTSHVGAHNAVGMGELYEAVFERPWGDRINDTRALRKVITELRDEGVPINSVCASSGGGYYLAAVGSELVNYQRREKKRALRILGRLAKMSKTSLPNYLGQIRLDMENSDVKEG